MGFNVPWLGWEVAQRDGQLCEHLPTLTDSPIMDVFLFQVISTHGYCCDYITMPVTVLFSPELGTANLYVAR